MNTVTPIVPALPRPSFHKVRKPGDAPKVVIGPPLSFLMYGDTGTQKTLSIGQAIRDGFYNRAVYLNLDKSLEIWATDPAILAAVEDERIIVEDIDQFDPNARMRIESIILELTGMWRRADGVILVNPNLPNFGVDLLAIDTVNLMHEIALKDFMATTYNAAGTKLDGLAAYGRVAVWMDEMIRLIHNSQRLTGAFVAHAKTVEDVTGANKIKPKLSGSFKDSFATIPSIVAYLDQEKHPESGKVVLTATVGSSDLCDSKNRYSLPDKIYDFNLSRLLATLPNKRVVTAPVVVEAPPAFDPAPEAPKAKAAPKSAPKTTATPTAAVAA